LSTDRTWVISIIGGASGVGKSTLLSDLSVPYVLNTGSLFKARMALENRDEVRSRQWIDFERPVAEDLAEQGGDLLADHQRLIVDTHFAARLGNGFRIGLLGQLIHSFGSSLASQAKSAGASLAVNVILVNCDPHALLRRRRLDRSRNRDLVPADCFNALRQNRTCSLKYAFEFRRVISSLSSGLVSVRYFVIENDHLTLSRERLRVIIGGNQDAILRVDH